MWYPHQKTNDIGSEQAVGMAHATSLDPNANLIRTGILRGLLTSVNTPGLVTSIALYVPFIVVPLIGLRFR